jgi:hypothetical protein
VRGEHAKGRIGAGGQIPVSLVSMELQAGRETSYELVCRHNRMDCLTLRSGGDGNINL